MTPEDAHERVERVADGSVRARGPVVDGLLHGYWQWWRKDGTRLRSGHFERGEPVGEWITYDHAGEVHKVTQRTAGTER
ncbi:hypothetical protein GTR02_14000 [Kineococcus sp. R8]|nr:hypothetical protein [Kineococcus siccus]